MSMSALSCDQVREIDRRAIQQLGMSGLVLMENAGRGVVDTLWELGIDGPVLIFCGGGNNGGDGFVIARHLDARLKSVKIVLCADPEKLHGDAAENFRLLTATHVPIQTLGSESGTSPLPGDLARADWIVDALLGTASTTALIFLILLGAAIFNAFLGFSQLPIFAADFFQNSNLAPMTVMLGMIVLYILMGFVMDSLAMILLTVPIFWPIIAGLDFGLGPEETKIWFGIISLIVVEMGLITPPVGLNVFVINSMARDVPMLETFKGVVPFLISDFLRVGLIIAFPILTLIIPRLLYVN